MINVLAPASVAELSEIVRSSGRVLAVGAGTKPRLSSLEVTRVSTTRLKGIVEYEPSEFTFTALAGTPIRDLTIALGACGQYLPFDPILVEAGATLGGTVAAGVSGPGRFRFGGIRDFILGIQFIDGEGRALRMGGKVVKNAAGFDLPKFFVGSLGRFGVLTELTFKVFPAPSSTLTLKLAATSIGAATRILVDAARGRWEIDALDIQPGSFAICVRLAGPAQALPVLANEIVARWPGEIVNDAQADTLWSDLRELRWADPGRPLIKVPITPHCLQPFYDDLKTLDGVRVHVTSGGNLVFLSLESPDQSAAMHELLQKLSLSGLTLRGDGPLWYGAKSRPHIAQSVKDVLDPQCRFPSLDE